MALLLDTHALLWALTDPTALSPASREILLDAESDVTVSTASVWELATKNRLGRLPNAGPLLGAHRQHVARLGARWLDMTADHALLAGGMTWAHRDPFDRMLAAQSLLEGLTLVTNDPVFTQVTGLRLAW